MFSYQKRYVSFVNSVVAPFPLLTGSSAFADLPRTMARIATSDVLCHTITYDQE